MEQKVENVNINPIISNINTKTLAIATPTPINHPQPQATTLKKGKKGSKNFFKVALFMMRGRSARKTKVLPVDDDSKNIWRKLVGSMRPMHLQSNSKSPPQQITQSEFVNANNDGDEGFDSIPNSPSFPNSPSCPNSPSPASSRYASAVGLSEMVPEEDSNTSLQREEEIKESDSEGEDGEGDGNGSDGDDMIDAKADEFIAQFYQQMRLQRMDIVDRHYNEISMRSLGL